jgi:hypothetical protein
MRRCRPECWAKVQLREWGHRFDSSRKIDEPEKRVSLVAVGAGERFINE